jgi:hypothetical protein
MTTESPNITPTTPPLEALELATRLHADLPELLASVAGQHLHSELADNEVLSKYFTPAGKLTTRASATSGSGETIIEKEALVGAGSYLRPNGSHYFTRKWGSTENDDVEVLRTCRANRQFVLLYGEAGCGKTALVEASFPDELYTLLGSGDTELSDFIGGYVQTPSGDFEWIDGLLVKAMSEGKVLLIDEIGLIDPKVLSALYGVMDGRDELIITQNPEREPVKSAEGFYVVGATNPNAVGVRLSEALLSRFTIQAEMTTDFGMAKTKLGIAPQIITASQNLAKKRASGEVSWSPQMRELLAFQKASTIFGTKFAIENLIACSPENDRPVIVEVLSRVFGEECRPAKI